jgi:hypothetical protein
MATCPGHSPQKWHTVNLTDPFRPFRKHFLMRTQRVGIVLCRRLAAGFGWHMKCLCVGHVPGGLHPIPLAKALLGMQWIAHPPHLPYASCGLVLFVHIVGSVLRYSFPTSIVGHCFVMLVEEVQAYTNMSAVEPCQVLSKCCPSAGQNMLKCWPKRARVLAQTDPSAGPKRAQLLA